MLVFACSSKRQANRLPLRRPCLVRRGGVFDKAFSSPAARAPLPIVEPSAILLCGYGGKIHKQEMCKGCGKGFIIRHKVLSLDLTAPKPLEAHTRNGVSQNCLSF